MTKIELVRRQKGLTQVELAKLIGVSGPAIVQVERGYRKPWPKIRKNIAQALGYPEEELFAPDGWPLQVELEEVIGR
ncbi:MAG: transcriptional regulator [Bacillus thermozeamaize]|uniref:Transcriptional regulator n=1 Tax=Bacillus thermozeamaize TaxID=230954 RepID=A0A1Y3PCD8_9BACI|nr:MAG: transcriptional regulator [Bacillus thermozeamaize]